MSFHRKFSLGLCSAFLVTLAACQPNSEIENEAASQAPDPAAEEQTLDSSSDTALDTADNEAFSEDRLVMIGVEDSQELTDFLAQLRQAAEANDRQSIADLVEYPFLTYDAGEVQKTYGSSTEFLSDYDSLITPKVLAALETANADSLFINQDGGSIESGTVWINNFGNGLRIYRING